MNTKAQESIFETAWKEYKDYDTYLKSISDPLKKERESFEKYVVENKSKMNEIVNKLFDINQKPSLHLSDIVTLKNRLVYLYEAYKDLIEIPEDVKKEILTFQKPKIIYKITKDGNAVDIDPEYTKNLKSKVKSTYEGFARSILEKNL